jgi:hypothetical protein
MNRKQRRTFNKTMKGKISADEMTAMNEAAQQIASLSQCNKCKTPLDPKSDHHLDTWKISVIDEKMLLICDECQ